jgi:hypothetical protein
MATYVLVAHQTALSEALLTAAREVAGQDPTAEFVVLVPATAVGHLLSSDGGETTAVARRRAAEAQEWLEGNGLRVVEARTGDEDPVQALSDLLRVSPRPYAGLVLSTLPPGLSRWLRLDVPSRVRRAFPTLRLMHVVGAPVGAVAVGPPATAESAEPAGGAAGVVPRDRS